MSKELPRIVIYILIIAFIMRLFAINQSLWLDEAIGALEAKYSSYGSIFTEFIKVDNHPPLYYLALKAWSQIFGFSEIALRSLSVVFGVLTVYFVYLIARLFEKKDKTYWIVPALFLATSPFHIYYSQEVRMYAMAALFATTAIYFYLKAIKDRQNFRSWLFFSVSILLLSFTDYVPIFLIPVFWLHAVISKKTKKWWKPFLLSHLPLLVFGLLWLPTLLVQSQRGAWLLATLPSWQSVGGGANIKQAVLVWMKFVLGRISLVDKQFYYTLVTVASIPFFVSLLISLKNRKGAKLFWMWLTVPLVLGFLVSVFFPAFIYFRFSFVLPAFYLLTAYGLLKTKKAIRLLLVASVLLVNTVGWLIYAVDERQQREQWREAVEFIESRADKDDVVVFEYPFVFAPYRWYQSGRVHSFGATDSISANQEDTQDKTEKIVEGKRGVYYFNYLHDLTDPQGYVTSSIENLGFSEIAKFSDFEGVGEITYYQR